MILSEFLRRGSLKAAFYGRYSTDSQDVETQQYICHQFASKYGITIVDKYIDESTSAFKKSLDKREYLDKLRKDARSGKFNCVLVYRADRLARKIDQHMQLWGEFRELGIPIILTESEKLYTTDSPTEIMAEIGLSSFESENTRIRTRDYYNFQTEEGKWLGGNLPYGYRYDVNTEGESIILEIPDRVEKVKEIFRLYKRGYGFRRVANIMNEHHPKDSENGKGKWVGETIKSIITNPFYAGFTTSQRIIHGAGNSINDRSEWKKGKCGKIPAIITEEEWNSCMGLYEKKKTGGVTHNQFITPYLFIDILYCKGCDSKVIAKNYTSGKKRKDGTRYGERVYICPKCKQKWLALKVHTTLLEEVLNGWYYQFYGNKKEEIHGQIMIKIEVELKDLDNVIQEFKKELSDLMGKQKEAEAKQKKLMEQNSDPDDLQLALVQYRISTQKKIQFFEQAIEQKVKEKQQLHLAYGDIENFKSIINSKTSLDYHLDEPELRKLLLYLFDKITINADYEYDLKAKVDLSQSGTIYIGLSQE